MFNFFVSADEGAWERPEFVLDVARFLEYTDDEYKERFQSLDAATRQTLLAAPALFAYETPVGKPARVGRLKMIQTRGRDIRVTFDFDRAIGPIDPDVLKTLIWELQIGDHELTRTHWAVKDRDLPAALRAAGIVAASASAPAVAAVPSYSRATILGACDMLQALGHSGLDGFILEVDVSGLTAPKTLGGLAKRASAIKEFVLNTAAATTRDGVPLGVAIVRKAADVEQRFQGAPQYVSAGEREAFLKALRRDGYDICDAEVVAVTTAPTAGSAPTNTPGEFSAPPWTGQTFGSTALVHQPPSREIAMTALNGKRVFIGHGRSPVWRDLKDLLRDRLGLSPVEFNTEPAAGMTTIERLQEMLSTAAFAFLVLTGEDQHADGAQHARENVIHEAGLFQGRLGFRRAIILLEEGCAEFSNIYGLTQIRFPKGDIRARSEAIREVLEREGLLPRSQ